MNFWIKLLSILDVQMTTPTAWGGFHILSWVLALTAAISLCLLYKHRKISVRTVLLAVSITVIVAEIYKQINYSFSYTDGIQFNYQWYAFPWQFCSTPMYAGLLAGILHKGKLHRPLCAYLATYAVFAGLCVMIHPGDVFIETVGINIQTMLCHGSMITLGIFLFYSKHVVARPKTLLYALPIFAGAVLIAAILNEVAYQAELLKEHTFNMFYISPHCDPHLPVYSSVQEVVPYPFCLIIYVAVFTLAAFAVLLLAMGIEQLGKYVASKRQASSEA